MTQSLRDLESQRVEILSQISQVGDLRPGSITAITGRCGKAVCHCHGSGVIEAGCKTIGARLKRSGMFWTVRGANAILALRCNMLSGEFDPYWEARCA